MSWRGILRKAGITSDGSNVDVAGIIRASNLITSRGVISYVHSGIGNDTSGAGARPQSPFASIEYAKNNRTVASRGDHIICLPGHVETVSEIGGLDLDIIGLTVWFLGEGANKAQIKFTSAVGADMDIDAANITLMWPLFVSDLDALTGPIDVNAADFTIVHGEYRDAVSKAATDCIVAETAATRMKILGWRYEASSAGAQKQSNIQLNGCDDVILENIDIAGDFKIANIENVSDEVLNIRLKNIVLRNTNTDPQPGIFVDTDATGMAENVKIRVASGTTYLSAVGKINWANDCEGFSADGESGEPLGTVISTGLEGKIDIIDAFHDVPVADVGDNVVISDITGNKSDAKVTTVGTTKTIMAYIKGIIDLMTSVIVSTTAALSNGATIFTIAGGMIKIESLVSECIATGDGGAATLQYNADPTVGASGTISNATGSVAAAVAGSTITLAGTALATAALFSVTGPNLIANPGTIVIPAGVITIVVGGSASTATWKHILRYKPLEAGVTVS